MPEPGWIQVLTRHLDSLDASPGGTNIFRGASCGIHLGVFVEPYLEFILEGRKTVESRFGVQRCSPHGRVAAGDLLLLKEASGPVVASCRITETWFFDLRVTTLASVRRRFARELCADDPTFWSARFHSTLATLMRIENVVPLPPIVVPKRDRRGWVTLRSATPLLSDVRT